MDVKYQDRVMRVAEVLRDITNRAACIQCEAAQMGRAAKTAEEALQETEFDQGITIAVGAIREIVYVADRVSREARLAGQEAKNFKVDPVQDLKAILAAREECGDCGVLEGQIHEWGCDMERCPFCGKQLISCDCKYQQLGLMDLDRYPDTCGLPPDIYHHGLSEADEERWEDILHEKGLIPFTYWPQHCERCGEEIGQFWMVSDEEWAHYIQRDMRNCLLCRPCYDQIKTVIDFEETGLFVVPPSAFD